MKLVLAVQSLEKFPMPLPDPMVLMISGFFLAMLIHAVMPWWPGWWQWCYELALLVEVVIKLFLKAKIVIGKVVWWYWCICVTCAQHFRVTSLFFLFELVNLVKAIENLDCMQCQTVIWKHLSFCLDFWVGLFLFFLCETIQEGCNTLQEILVGFVRSIGCPVSAVSGKVGK